MKNKAFLSFLLLIILLACSPNKDDAKTEIPGNIISPDSMVMIISDIQNTEAILREFKRTGEDNPLRSAKFLKQTFDKHGITPEQYKTSIAFYEQHQETYYKIYQDVVSRLTQMQTELKNDTIE
jgi:Skp family chaperone for outer membrane proteins